MNLIDAVKSGRPFRRPASAGWIVVRNNAFGWHGGGSTTITEKDVLADDWETMEPEVRITRAQFWDILSKAEVCVVEQTVGPKRLMLSAWTIEQLARNLGLEP